MNDSTRFSNLIESINKYTEISIAPTGNEYEWYWRCKESETTFPTAEAALLDAINFICRDYEALLVDTLAKEDDGMRVCL